MPKDIITEINQYLSIIKSQRRFIFFNNKVAEVQWRIFWTSELYQRCAVFCVSWDTVRLHWLIPNVKGVYFLFCAVSNKAQFPQEAFLCHTDTNLRQRLEEVFLFCRCFSTVLTLMSSNDWLMIYWCFNATCSTTKSTNHDLISPPVTR